MTTTDTEATAPEQPVKKENIWLNLILNVVLPSLILMKLSKEDRLGPEMALVAAAALPICYGIYDYIVRKKINFLSVLGLLLVLSKGLFGLFKLNPIYYAISETVHPLIFGGAILWTLRWEPPLVEKVLMNPQLLNVEKIRRGLALNENVEALRPLVVKTTWLYAATTLFSAVMNFVIARMVVKTDPQIDQEAYVAETGRSMLIGQAGIGIPLMVMTVALFFWFLKKLRNLTGLTSEELLPPTEDSEEKPVKGE